MISNFVSIGTIASKLYRDLGINKEINFSNIVEWVNEVLLKVGAYSQFKEISDYLELVDGKVCLPNGFYKLVDISYNGRPLHWATNTLVHNYGCEGCQIPVCCTGHNFYINDSYIITDIDTCNNGSESDKICIVYLGMPVDCDGYPMIPDDVYFAEACAKYCTYMMDYQEWRKGQLPDKVMNKSEADYLWYVNSARGVANQPSLAQLENLRAIMTRLIPKQNSYYNHFRDVSSPERRKRF